MILKFADAHTHTNPVSGMGMKTVAKRFRDLGGWFLAIVSLPPSHYGLPPTLEGYRKSYEILLRECSVAREFGLQVACIVGIHPADVEKLVTRTSPSRYRDLIELYTRVLNVIEELLRNGAVQGLGEFGRPHYRANPEAFALNEFITIRALELAKDYNVPIHIHCEQSGDIAVKSLKVLAKLVGIDKRLVVIHHADTKTLISASRAGFSCTVLGRYELLKSLISQGVDPVFMIESDHIDDPRRPGVAAYPWEIVESQRRLLDEGLVNEDYLQRINVENIRRVYRHIDSVY